MASRLALRSLRTAGKLSPTLLRREGSSRRNSGGKLWRKLTVARPAVVVPRAFASQQRSLATHEKAASIINSVPSSSLWTKTGGVVLGTALTAAAVSTELYVANEETVLAIGFFIILAATARSIGAPYSSWAQGHIDRIKGILNASRQEHTAAITERIDSVKSLKEVVPFTEQLYAVAKETNTLEHENFLLQQDAAVKQELKAVLDSWVRFEQQQREAEHTALVKSIRESVEAELAKPAFKKQLLEEAITQIEQISRSKAI